jgi:hypothetical protein
MAPRKDVKQRLDYVERGSAKHATILGLEPDPSSPLKWRLADVTQYGPSVTDRFLDDVLHQKISDLTSKVPEPQSDDRSAPNYAPKMWMPKDEEDSVQGIV